MVTVEGERIGKVSPRVVRRIAEQLVAGGFLKAKSLYALGPCRPHVTTVVLSWNNRKKLVTVRGCGPDFVFEAADEIEHLGDISEWIESPIKHFDPILTLGELDRIFEPEPLTSIRGLQPDPEVLRKLVEHLGPSPLNCDILRERHVK